MPVLINNLKTKGYFKVRINLDEAFDAEDAAQAEFAEQWAGAYLDLRELNASESARLQEQNNVEALGEILRGAIVGHNLYREENKLASNDEVSEIIQSSGTVYSHVIQKWTEALPLAKRSAKSSAS
jgi:hypothetical protein